MKAGIVALTATLYMVGCAPLSPSIPKNKVCDVPADIAQGYDAVAVGDRSYDVERKMNSRPDSESTSNSTLIFTYIRCKKIDFYFIDDQLTAKTIQ